MAPGATSKFGAPMFEPEVFRQQTHYIEESTYDIVGTFQRHYSDLVPGELCPLSPLVTPLKLTDAFFASHEILQLLLNKK